VVHVLPEEPRTGRRVLAALRYPGAKWALAPRIVPLLGAHDRYVEPYLGSGAVFFSKEAARHEVLNDLDRRVVGFWRTLRERTDDLLWALETTPWARAEYEACAGAADDEVEAARRFVVRAWQAHAADQARTAGWRHAGTARAAAGMSRRWRKVPQTLAWCAQRLADAEIECRPALEVITRTDGPGTCLYVDPPYPREVRAQRRGLYAVDSMGERDHAELLEVLVACAGRVVVSGYPCRLYDRALAGWRRVEIGAPRTHGGRGSSEVTEVVWTNR